MDFFGDYSIETASCHPSSLTIPEDEVYAPNTLPPQISPRSPRDSTTSYPTSIANVTDLARQFSLQNLEPPGLDNDDGRNESFDYSSSPGQHLQVPSPLRRTSVSMARSPPCWKRRMQRQSNIRLLTDPSHLRSISEMVQRMVESEDQCGVVKREPDLTPTPATPFTEDDDFDSCDSGSPRSLSSSSSNGRRPSYFNADFSSPLQRRNFDPTSLSHSLKDSRVQKNRAARRGARR
ncbi:hypothetical protein K461DRAFT_280624 [Myriangium duriaei CBS 260.36]|uniref:Uncharacterized protein n=1 Tax=Myriangium duriaei CBS 260.36 TaxID=1168546 RepID=A0A9P4IZF1_9PEZI|nr:hypothetical protein K461DRAFT_280624 [Myriangium duriaei CBS 260.36]